MPGVPWRTGRREGVEGAGEPGSGQRSHIKKVFERKEGRSARRRGGNGDDSRSQTQRRQSSLVTKGCPASPKPSASWGARRTRRVLRSQHNGVQWSGGVGTRRAGPTVSTDHCDVAAAAACCGNVMPLESGSRLSGLHVQCWWSDRGIRCHMQTNKALPPPRPPWGCPRRSTLPMARPSA